MRALGIALVVAAMVAVPSILGGAYWFAVFTTVLINVLLACSLRTIFLTGRLSLGHVGFMVIGAYTSAVLVMRADFPIWASVMIGGLLAAAAALVVAFPFLRTTGVSFSILTLLMAETIRLVAYYWRTMTGGSMGLTGVPAPGAVTIPGLGAIRLGTVNNYYYLTLVVVTVCLLVLYGLERTDLGLKWKAIRDAENLAQSVGIRTMAYKMINFVTACFFAGIAGGLYAHFQGGLDSQPTSRFGMMTSLYLIVYMVVGGQGRFLGPAVGAALLTIIMEVASEAKQYQPIVVGLIAILVTLFMREGVAGTVGNAFQRLFPQWTRPPKLPDRPDAGS